jgi:hypothetical protein
MRCGRSWGCERQKWNPAGLFYWLDIDLAPENGVAAGLGEALIFGFTGRFGNYLQGFENKYRGGGGIN